MRPLRLTASGLGRFPDLDLEIPHGTAAIVGPNGAGKSTILKALEAALFADGSRDLAPLLGPWADRLEVTLVFEHAGDIYRVRQAYRQAASGRGTATVDLERHGPTETWEPLTGQSADATRDLIVQTLGLGRRTFRSSSFLAQGDAGAFTEATPADRKAIIGEALDPHGLWPRLAEAARNRAKALDATLVADRARMEILGEQAARIPEMMQTVANLSEQEAFARAALMEAEHGLRMAQDALAANQAAAERHRAAAGAVKDAETAAETGRVAYAKAKQHADAIPAAETELARLEALAGQVPELEQRVQAQQETRAARAAALERRDAAEKVVDRERIRVASAQQAVLMLTTKATAAAERLRHLEGAEDGTERCPTCAQILGAEARAAAVEALRRELAELEEQEDAANAEALDASRTLTEVTATADAITVPDPPEIDSTPLLTAARQAGTDAAALRARLSQLHEAAAALPELRETLRTANATVEERKRALMQAALDMGDVNALEANAARARTTVDTARTTLDQLAEARAIAAETVKRCEQAETEFVQLRQKTAAAGEQLDLLALAGRAYGRDGIPVLLAEAVIPQIEAEANRILELMPLASGAVLRVELRTQRALKTDTEKIRETLDILVSDQDGPRDYATYSGGERARLNIALRIALARLLAHRRGAESRILCIDELEYMDALGQEQLVEVVRSVAGDFDTVLLVSHADVLRDAFDTVLEVENRGGVSRLAGVLEEVAA